ncbi:MAG: pyruvate dehydrogenase (acetyl-transferring), homodimeric type [Gammaproteobacteria bacterium]|nr:pyruvate dehydrogenase (acetyl-transferring), homodimeric type [Gammaproteobacteria bacterium]MYD80776.1 pyruvate dehydrogenase (acetyl-transferring), homodimeric type [Gammaproteobacteria bacterium]
MATNINSPDTEWENEQREWLEALESVLQEHGEEGVKTLLGRLQTELSRRGVQLEERALNTPYTNTIPLRAEPAYPGDIELENRIESIIRWNAVAMVLQAYDSGSGVGGHIATYTSASTMMEVGFNHFFRAPSEKYGGDQVHFQAHAAPGVYARAWLEGRIPTDRLKNFRRELGENGGLPSYPHPRRMPHFWQMPTASMGLSTPCAIYQARFAKYLEHRGLKPKNGGKIWLFIGDGESDEPEVLGTINMASREQLDNLVLVINCNLQRLDGPVRGNGKIIQELERTFRGADWHVVKVIWGGGWDPILERDTDGILQARMEQAVDGDYQMYTVSPGNAVREHWVENSPQLIELMKTLSDEEIQTIKRGGHDHRKLYAAYHHAMSVEGKPCVILAKTVKGDGLGLSVAGRNTVHQKKYLTPDERHDLADRFDIPLDKDAIERAEFYMPPKDSQEIQYLSSCRESLGGPVPYRHVQCPTLTAPNLDFFQDMVQGTGERSISTTMSVVRMLQRLLRHRDIGKYVVPIVPDEARTFGMDGLFPQAGIYSPAGQVYQPVDAGTIAPYREAEDGQILQEGICEAGAMASFLAAGTAYANHGLPMIPFYIFYSIFGFQRVGDLVWACGDMMCKGFLLGGTSGRTTLNGEGVQHQDGHSHVLAATVPNLVSYDPAFAYEIAVIVREGIDRMYSKQDDVFYYLTVTNQNYPMPPMPDNVEEGIVNGMYPYEYTPDSEVNLLGSGAIMVEVLEAAQELRSMGKSVNVWSVTSYTELSRQALRSERELLLSIGDSTQKPYVSELLENEPGVFVAASDYQKALPLLIAPWIKGEYIVLGTDGFGLSESRQDLRDYFEVSSNWIVFAALSALAQSNREHKTTALEFASKAGLDLDKAAAT